MSIVWRGTRAELIANLNLLPSVLTGSRSDPHGLGKVFLAVVGNEVLLLIQDAFKVKSSGATGSDGITWLALKEATLERRRRKGIEKDDILKETGELYASLTPGSDDPDSVRIAGQVFDIEPGSITVGCEGPKADAHQYGAGHIPPRPIVPDSLPAAWERDIEEAMERGLEKVIERMCQLGGVG